MTKRVLVLAAHPDDETLGCGATLARLAAEGHTTQLLTFTDGEGARGKTENRNKQLQRCCEILGISKYDSASFPDNRMDTVALLEVCKFIEDSAEDTPDIIFTHHPHCLNVDHQIVYQATLVAFRPQFGKKYDIYSYFVPSSTDYNPTNEFLGNVYFDVSGYESIKLECLRACYNAEMREHPHSRSYEQVENIMKVWGGEVGVNYAEKFQLIRSAR